MVNKVNGSGTQAKAPETNDHGSKNYLQRCVKELKIKDIESPYKFEARLTKTVMICTYVAFTALAISAFFLTGVYAPFYIPIVTLAILVSLNPVHHFAAHFKDKSDEANQKLERLKSFEQHYRDLPKATHELKRVIPSLSGRITKFKEISPLIARFVFWKKQESDWKKEADTFRDLARKMQKERLIKNKEVRKQSLRALQKNALKRDKHALKAKIAASFHLAVMQKPKFEGRAEDVYTFHKTSTEDRLYGRAVNDPSIEKFLHLKNRDLTVKEVQKLSHADLAKRILSGMAA